MPYEYKPHTADMIIEATGKTFEGALEAAAQGLFDFIADTKKLKARRKLVIKEHASTPEDLVTFTLSRLLSESNGEEMFLKKFKITKLDGNSLEGVAYGDEMRPELGENEVKAITHHLTSVQRHDCVWKVRVLLDV